MRLTAAACAALAFCLFSAAASAQEITGSVVGTVTDASGSGVPGARVTVTNTDRNTVVRTAETDSEGNYNAPLLPIGNYDVSVEAKGFKKATQKGITLNVNDRLTVNMKLEVGDVQQEITIEAGQVQVELQSPTAGNLIEGPEIRELALNSRNYEQLVALMPGVTNTSTSDQIYVGVSNPLSGVSNAVTFAINGARTDQNNWTVDGADNVDRGANLTLLNYPSVDAIAEFRVLRGQYSAEFGRNAGGQVNVITKSGTNRVHFDAYEFFRNDKIAANNFFNNANKVNVGPNGKARVAPLRYNNFGYTAGGPVYIPKVYDGRNKTFFFFSQEFRRVINYTAVQGTAPTADEKKGIFSLPVCTQFSGSTCLATATQVPIDPVAQAYITDVFSHVPDAPASHIINLSLRNVYNARQELLKIDHVFNERWSLAGRYIQDAIPTTEPRGLFTGAALPDVSTTRTNAPGRGVHFRLTGSITPSLLNEVGYAYSYGAVLSDPIGLDASVNSPNVAKIMKLPFPVTLGRIPTLSLGGVSSVTGFGPYRDYNRNHQWFDNLTRIAGKHTLKFGGTVFKYQKRENAGGNNVGSFTFSTTPRPTGTTTTAQGWANFLLGQVSSFTQVARDITPDIHQNQAEFYVQDDLRVRRNFTLNVGVRYSLFRQPTDANGFLNTFDPAAFDPAKAPVVNAAGNLVANTGDPYNGQIRAGKNSPYGSKIAVENNKNFAPRIGFSWDPFGDGKTAVRAGYGMAYDQPAPGRWEDPITANPISVQSITYTNTTFASITSGTTPPPASPPALTGIGSHFQTPYSQQWSFDVQRELPFKTMMDVGYFGNKGTHLWGEPDINELPAGYAVKAGLINENTQLTTTTDPIVNAYRPYRGYRAINMYQPWFNSSYNSLQASFRKRFARSGFFGLNYTFSKYLTNAGSNAATPQNTYDFAAERGFSPYDRAHVFTGNWNYELPFFRKSKGFMKAAFGGWQYSGIVSAATGLPFNPSSSSRGIDPGGLGILGAGSGAVVRADFICDPNKNAPHLLTQWFNTACMADVPVGAIRPGNAARNSVRGPGYQKWDMSLMKNFYPTEKVRIQFRAETFNTFNHTNWSNIGPILGSATYGQVTAARDARIVQFAMKLYY
jgi:hypothetical protein